MSSMAALREVKALKLKMTPSQTEVLLGSFVAKGWLERSEYVGFLLPCLNLLHLVCLIDIRR